jgi:hypothetical protein
MGLEGALAHRATWIVVAMAAVAPLACLRSLDALRHTSVVALLAAVGGPNPNPKIPVPSAGGNNSVWPPHRPREDGLTHHADNSRTNLAAALAFAFEVALLVSTICSALTHRPRAPRRRCTWCPWWRRTRGFPR